MIVRYFELSAMIGVGHPGRPVVLNDLHKTAWSLYTGTGKMEVPKGVERPFTFRADALPGRQGMYVFIIRSPFEFAGATARSIDLSLGNQLTLEFIYSPYKRIETADKKTRRVVPPENQWATVAGKRFLAAGLEPSRVSLTPLPKLSMRPNQVRHPLVAVESMVTVTDSVKAADAWIRGATMMRAYGMGQLTVLPESPTQAVVA